MIVVPVFITSCQVSDKPKIGPVTIQTAITPAASRKAQGQPHCLAMILARLPWRSSMAAPPGLAVAPFCACAVTDQGMADWIQL